MSKTVVLAGSGETSAENTRDLLNDFLDDEDTLVLPFLPEASLGGGFTTVLDWLEDNPARKYEVVSQEYSMGRTTDDAASLDWLAEGAVVARSNADVTEAVLKSLADNDEGYLVLLWGNGETAPDEATEHWMKVGEEHDLKVLDLTQGLDYLTFLPPAEEAEPEPEPEPEPDPAHAIVTEAKNRRKNKKQEVEEKPLVDPEPEPEPVDEVLDRVGQEAEDAEVFDAKPEEMPASADPVVKVWESLHAVVCLAVDKLPSGKFTDNAASRFAEGFFWAAAALEDDPENEVEQPQAAPQAAEAPRRGRGRPRKDGSPAQPRTAAERAVLEIWDEDDGVWVKKGRGRAAKGAKTRWIDPNTGDVVVG